MAAYVLDGQLTRPVIGTTLTSSLVSIYACPATAVLDPGGTRSAFKTHTGEASRLHRGWHILGRRGYQELPHLP